MLQTAPLEKSDMPPAESKERLPSSARTPSPRRLLLMVVALLVALTALVLAISRGGLPLADLPLHDFVEYWAAGRLLADGENPYDPEKVKDLEKEAGRTEEPILMWNPPWALPF